MITFNWGRLLYKCTKERTNMEVTCSFEQTDKCQLFLTNTLTENDVGNTNISHYSFRAKQL